jgi:phospholipid-binding lipoprotein MlaA
MFKKLVLIAMLGCLGACASHQSSDGTEQNVDRFEGFNRAMFAFNMKLDRWFLRPVTKGYDAAVPGFAKTGVSNFFDNLGEVSNIVNDVLQWKWKQAGNDTGRLLINSTVGVFGLFDVASPMGLKESEGEDFGQTLSKWGVAQGPYIVLPFFGPSTIRDGVGMPVEYVLNPVTHVEDQAAQNSLQALGLVDTRHGLLELEELVTGDQYIFIRDAYLQRREYLINDGELELEFDEDEFEDF